MIQWFRESARKIGYGLLYGAGFGAAAGTVLYFISEKMTASMWNEAAIEKVAITSHEKVIRDDTVSVLGTVENRGSESVRAVKVQLDLFDKGGKFVEQCYEYLPGNLKAGEKRNFKISCSKSCKGQPTVEHETYKVQLIGL